MKKIKQIEIGLENCEVYIVPHSSVKYMYTEGFNQIYNIHYNENGECSKYYRAYSFEVKLKNLENIKAHWDFSESFKERIHSGGDITYITFVYEDGKKFSFYVPWNYDNDQYNSYQNVWTDKKGLMNIKIKKVGSKSK